MKVHDFLYSDEYCRVAPVYDHSTTDYLDISDLEIHNIAWIVAGICAALACILSFYLLYQHLTHYTMNLQQKHIVRILMMVPIYAVDSFLSFRFYWLAVYFDVARDCYEAFVIYTFFCLLTEYVGGYHHGKEHFAAQPAFKLVFPLNFITIEPKRGLLRQCKRLTLQYVLIRPAMTILALVLHSVGELCPGNWSPLHAYLWISFVNFCSVTVAMYGLILFYVMSRDIIARYQPIPKFLSIKFVIFLSFWQGLVVAGLMYVAPIQATTYWSTENISTGVQDALTCVEMLIAAIWHIKAFSYKPFVTETTTSMWRAAADAFRIHDIAEDMWNSFRPNCLNPKKKGRKSTRSSSVQKLAESHEALTTASAEDEHNIDLENGAKKRPSQQINGADKYGSAYSEPEDPEPANTKDEVILL